MGYIDVAGVSHTLADGRVLFADVSFRVGEGAKIALIGPYPQPTSRYTPPRGPGSGALRNSTAVPGSSRRPENTPLDVRSVRFRPPAENSTVPASSAAPGSGVK